MNGVLVYHELDEFQKEFKSLLRRYKTLEKDFEHVKKFVIENLHLKNLEFYNATPKVNGCCTDKYTTIKIKKFPCKSMVGKGGKTGIRVIYVYEIGTFNIYFIEIYTHCDGVDNLNKKRLEKFLKGLE